MKEEKEELDQINLWAKMKILFIEPYSDFPVENLGSQIGINLGLLSIAAYIRTKIKNIELDFFSAQISTVLGENILIDDVIKKNSPDIVATTAITSSFPNAIEIIKEAKKNGCITILGGIFSTLNYNKILECYSSVDFIIRGEGEIAFCNLIKNIVEGTKNYNITGVAYRSKKKIINNNFSERLDFSCLPPPAYDLAPIEKLIANNIPIDIQTSRGCLANCTYCSLIDLWGRKFTKKNNMQVYTEIMNLVNKYGASKFRIVDDTFTLDNQRTEKLCEMLSGINPKLNFFVLTRPDMVSRKMISSMVNAGINRILFGIETMDTNCLNKLNRNMKNKYDPIKMVQKLINWSEIYDFVIHPTFMFGTPGETKQNIDQTASILIKNQHKNLLPFIIYFTPHPGTRLYKDINKFEIDILTKDISKYSHFYPVCVPKSLGKGGLNTMIDNYNKISIETKTQEYNPLIDLEKWEIELSKKSNWTYFF